MMSVDLLSDCCNTGSFNDTSSIIDDNAETEMVTVAPGSPSKDIMPTAPPLSAFDGNSQQPPAAAASIYQMNFDVEHIGKKKPQSKRQATWTYGFPKQKTESTEEIVVLEEHQARLTWSTHSGKYTIEVDGVVVFESCAKGSVLEHKFIYNHTKGCVGHDSTEAGYIKMRIVACRKPPVRSSTNFRCYEFVIGTTVFRNLPRMMNTTTNNNHQYYGGGEDFHNEDYHSMDDVGVLSSILDIVDPSWRSSGGGMA